MKLGRRAHAITWELHAWVGILASFALFTMFFAGSFALFYDELSLWEEGHLVRGDEGGDEFDAWVAAATSTRAAEELEGARISVFTFAETSHVAVEVTGRDGVRTRTWVDRATRTTAADRSRIAVELFHLHFLRRLPLGMEISGIVALFLLIATTTGLALQWKDLARQLWQLRIDRPVRVSGSDAHKVLGVFTLPFVLVMGWTGAALALGATLEGALERSVGWQPNGDEVRASMRAARTVTPPPPTRRYGEAPSIDAFVAAARRAAPDAVRARPVRYVDLRAYRDEAGIARVIFEHEPAEVVAPRVTLLARDASVFDRVFPIESDPAHVGRAATTSESFERSFFALHYGTLGGGSLDDGWLLRVLYALLSWLAAGVVVTGTLVWIERRDRGRTRRTTRWLEATTLGWIVATLVATACAFLFNRILLLVGDERVATFELAGVVGVWGLVLVTALVRRASDRRWLVVAARAAGALYALVVAIDVARLAMGAALVPDVHFVDALLTGMAALHFAVGHVVRGARAQ